MANVSVKIDDRKIDAMFDTNRELRRYMDVRVQATVAAARVEAPVRTSALQRSIGSTYHGGGRWTVSASAKHAKWVHEGTKPHPIKARTKKTLRFFWARVGRVVYPRQVQHPGNEPNRFLTRAMHQVWD